MPFKYIGRTTDFKGKSVWEILGNLKNFGVNRLIARNMLKRYPEPSYIKVLKVEALNNPPPSYDIKRKVIVLAEKTFRGIKSQNLVQMESSTYKSDYFLIPKYKESEYYQHSVVPRLRVLPNKMEYPPLLKEYIIQQRKSNGIPIAEEPKMTIIYNETGIKNYRVAKEGEQPTEPEPTIGLGKPTSHRLFENIKQ